MYVYAVWRNIFLKEELRHYQQHILNEIISRYKITLSHKAIRHLNTWLINDLISEYSVYNWRKRLGKNY